MIGELAALGTALVWSGTYTLFTIAVRAVGPHAVNCARLLIALLFLMATNWAMFGEPLPIHAEPARWGWLALAGVIGFAISDAMMFGALYRLGAQRSALIKALVPVVSTLLAWVSFGETLTGTQILAVFVVVAGILIVLWGPKHTEHTPTTREYVIGVLFALGATLTQALRYLFSRQGLADGFSPLSANTMQILAATVAIWTFTLIRGGLGKTVAALGDRRGGWATLGGAVTGPFLGVTLSLVALQRAPIGIASTLMALPPVFLLPLSYVVFKERIGLRAVAGTALATIGVALIFLA